MNDHLQSEFILSAKKSLEDLARDMRQMREARGRERRELIENIFRHTHTLKGTASAAGLEPTAHLAHEIENLLDSIRLGHARLNEESVGALREATAALAENLESAARGETLYAPAALVERLQRLAVGGDEETPAFSEKILSLLPYEIAGALNAYERHRLGAAAEDGLNLFVVAFGLPLATFDEKFRLLSDALAARGEIISTLPGVEDAEPEKISFRVVYATEADGVSVAALAESVVAVTLTELKLMQTDEEFSESFSEERASAHFINQSSDSEKLYETVAVSRLLERARRAGEMAARAAGKEIEFEIVPGSPISVERDAAEAISNALLHLVRNAVDHGVESAEKRAESGKEPHGRIRLEARKSANRLVLRVSDDGRGIDLEEIVRAGLERGIVQKGEVLSREDALRLIFRTGFSTAASVTTLSGRGVGLDVVETVVKELGGEIEVESAPGTGTTFKIILPLSEGASG